VLKGAQGQSIRVIVSECDDFEYCDVTIITSWSHRDVIDDVTNPRADVAVGTLLYGPYWSLTNS